jgi:alkaline phosphatase
MQSPRFRSYLVAFAVVVASSSFAAKQAKNVILMIADGTGFNAYAAAAMYEGRYGKEVFNGKGWIKLAVSTYPLNQSSKPQRTGIQDPKLVYSPDKAWDKSDAYKWLKATPTDSAAAATAMGTGVKTYNNSIGWSDMNEPLSNVHYLFKKEGKATGVITTVPWSHATPAGMVARTKSRNNYKGIAKEMIEQSGMDVIMGGGHPWYDADGKRVAKMGSADYVGGSLFTTASDKWNGVRLIESKSDFEALAKGTLNLENCSRLIGTARVEETLQQGRSTKDWNKDGKVDDKDIKVAPVGGDPFNDGVPSLETMTQGALRLLSKNRNGFFLMVEGGAVDWANHSNQPGRMIEEATEFFRAVESVDQWVAKHGGWSNNLVIVTADHETGCLWGPGSDKTIFDPIVDLGKGKIPGLRYNYGSHTNSLVPLFARGAGAEEFIKLAKLKDPVRGNYVNNTDIFMVMKKSQAKTN